MKVCPFYCSVWMLFSYHQNEIRRLHMNTLRLERMMIGLGMTFMELTGIILLICGILGIRPF